MVLNGFMIGQDIKKLFKIKVDTPTAGHPVYSYSCLSQYKTRSVIMVPFSRLSMEWMVWLETMQQVLSGRMAVEDKNSHEASGGQRKGM